MDHAITVKDVLIVVSLLGIPTLVIGGFLYFLSTINFDK